MPKTAMIQSASSTAAVVALCALVLIGRAQAQGTAHADLSGTYHCQPDPTPCLWSGQSPSMAQSGNNVEIKNDKGEISNAVLTSDSTISAGPPFNSFGVVRPDNSIDWSNGTKWRK
jgi:hypothetical protein